MRRDIIECPECGYFMKEPDECFNEDEIYFHECEHCEKTVGISPYYIKGYNSFKTPCQNEGEDHDWKPMKGAPIEYFVDKFQCSYCGEQKTIK